MWGKLIPINLWWTKALDEGNGTFFCAQYHWSEFCPRHSPLEISCWAVWSWNPCWSVYWCSSSVRWKTSSLSCRLFGNVHVLLCHKNKLCNLFFWISVTRFLMSFAISIGVELCVMSLPSRLITVTSGLNVWSCCSSPSSGRCAAIPPLPKNLTCPGTYK